MKIRFNLCILITVELVIHSSISYNYCILGEDHVLCKYKDMPAEHCPGIEAYKYLKKHEKLDLQNVHNEWRSKLALGKMANCNYCPEASDMSQVNWDEELEIIAYRYAIQCINSTIENSSTNTDRFEVTQFLFYQEYPLKETQERIFNERNILEKNWGQEIKLMNEEIISGKTENKILSQVFFSDIEHVGCARYVRAMSTSSLKILICNYGPKKEIGEPLYTKGQPCSNCPLGKHCRKGLCFKKKIKMRKNSSPGKNNDLQLFFLFIPLASTQMHN